MNTKNNKQFQNSDTRMKQAMLELMNTMSFEKITVRLICQKAEVNRSTFYAHYADLYDMVKQIDTNLQKKLIAEYFNEETVPPFSLESFTTFLKFIREHRDFYRAALDFKQYFPLKQSFDRLWEEKLKPLCLKAGIKSENEMMFYFVGFQAGFKMILKRWVEQDCAENEENLAQIIRNMLPSIWRLG